MGTNIPVTKLHVAKNITAYPAVNVYGQLEITDSSDIAKRLSIGVNGSTNSGFIQAINNGGIYQDLLLNQGGGNVGIGVATPTAKTHLVASTTTANTASLKIDEGSRQTTPEDGTINYVANNLEFVETSTIYTLAKTLTATSTLDFASTAASTSTDLTVTLTGAADGDAVSIGVPNASTNANSCFTAFVSAANTITVRFNNYQTVGAIDPASGSFRISLAKY